MRSVPISIVLVLATCGVADAAQAQGGQDLASFTYVLVIAVSIGVVIGLFSIKSGLANSKWSIADALSEEADVTLQGADGNPIIGQDGKAVAGSELRASASRLIALLGLVAILSIYVGFGLVVLRDFAEGQLPDDDQLKRISVFLFSGVTMFAPYLVNKFSSVFDWLKPSPKP